MRVSNRVAIAFVQAMLASAASAEGLPCVVEDYVLFGGLGSYVGETLVSNGIMYKSGGSEVAIYDYTNPRSPVRLGACRITGPVLDMKLAGEHIYAVDRDEGVAVIDVSDPTAPLVVGSTGVLDNPRQLVVVDDNLFVMLEGPTLLVIDAADVSAPTVVADVPLPSQPRALCSVDDMMLVSTSADGLLFFDVGIPTAPILINSEPGLSGYKYLWADQSTAVLASGSQGHFVVVDTSDPMSPVELSRYDNGAGALQVDMIGDRLYVGNSIPGLQIFDLSDRSSPRPIGEYYNRSAGDSFALDRGLAYDGSNSPHGMTVIDVRAPSSSPMLGECASTFNASDAVVGNGYVYVADRDLGLLIYDIRDPENPVLVGSYGSDDGSSYRALDVVGDLVYLGVSKRFVGAGIRIIDVSQPESSVSLGVFYGSHGARSIKVVGTVAYLANNIYRLETVDVSDPLNPVGLGQQTWPYYALDVDVVGTTAYVADGASGLSIVDASDPTDFVLVGRCLLPTDASDIEVRGDYAYVADAHRGLYIIDVTDSTRPTVVGAIDTHGTMTSVSLVGDLAICTNEGFGIFIVDVSDVSNPTLVGRYLVPGTSLFARANGDRLAVLSQETMWIVDLADDCAKRCVADLTTQNAPADDRRYGMPDGVVSAADILFFANSWIADDLWIADVTSQNAPLGDPNFGEPDGVITGIDIQFYVNAWLAGCP